MPLVRTSRTCRGHFRRTANGRFLYGRVTNHRLREAMTTLPNYDDTQGSIAPTSGASPLSVTYTAPNPAAPSLATALNGVVSARGGWACYTATTPIVWYPKGLTGGVVQTAINWNATSNYGYSPAGTYNGVAEYTDAIGRKNIVPTVAVVVS
jgi:hypothetical protein